MMTERRWSVVVAAMVVGAAGLCSCGKREEAAQQGATNAAPPQTAAAATATGDEIGPFARVGGGTFDAPDEVMVKANNRGVGLMGKFDYPAALAVFAELVKQRPQWLDAQVNLAIATLNRQMPGDEQRALARLESVVQVDPGHVRAHYCIGLLKLFLGEGADALEHFEVALNAQPNDAYAVYYVAQCREQAGDFEGAYAGYRKAMELDGYLRSAAYRLSQMARRLGRDDEAREYGETFQRLANVPRARLVEFKYTRMGPLGMAMAVNSSMPVLSSMPGGPVFEPATELLVNAEAVKWRTLRPERPVSITTCDVNGDGALDVFIAGVIDDERTPNAMCINRGDNTFEIDAAHPLAGVAGVNAALWGDVDNDGLVDVYLCCAGVNRLFQQGRNDAGETVWRDVTEQAGVGNAGVDTIDGALADFDHDGDLDVFCVNADGPNELFTNNLDGTFRAIAAAQGIAGDGSGSEQVILVDLDRDRDLDIVVINRKSPADIWVNDRLWSYRKAEEPRLVELLGQGNRFAVMDREATGEVSFVRAVGEEFVHVQRDGMTGAWVSSPTRPMRGVAGLRVSLTGVGDLNGTGLTEAIGLQAFAGASRDAARLVEQIAGWTLVVMDVARGPAVVSIELDAQPLVWMAGAGRHAFAGVRFTGGRDGDTMRSNASGVGTHYAARIGANWVAGSTLGITTGPGQSLQPMAIGLGGAASIDFVAIDWSDGVYQSEVELAAGELHEITETQRQLSSCPVIFAWDGERYAFVSDVLGVGGVGYMVEPGMYAPSRPWENFLMPSGAMEPRDGRFMIKLSEPMEEACYLDAVRLVAYDLPPGWQLVLDERMGIAGPEPTGMARFFTRELQPVRAVNERGDDVTGAISAADFVAADVGELDRRFIGRLAREHVITLEFDRPLDAFLAGGASGSELLLVADGWVEYPYSQTMFAAWQAGATFDAPTLEARGGNGEWVTVLEQFGYPAGMPRRMSVPLPSLPEGARELRLRTNQEIYWDRLAVVVAEPVREPMRRELPLVEGRLGVTGFAQRIEQPQRRPDYDYARRVPLWDARYQRGAYSREGDVLELLLGVDDAVAIFGPGEEIHLEFADDGLLLQPGWTRRYVVEFNGWCKDMDLFTQHGETLEPLPQRGSEASPMRDVLHERYNTREMSGR